MLIDAREGIVEFVLLHDPNAPNLPQFFSADKVHFAKGGWYQAAHLAIDFQQAPQEMLAPRLCIGPWDRGLEVASRIQLNSAAHAPKIPAAPVIDFAVCVKHAEFISKLK